MLYIASGCEMCEHFHMIQCYEIPLLNVIMSFSFLQHILVLQKQVSGLGTAVVTLIQL